MFGEKPIVAGIVHEGCSRLTVEDDTSQKTNNVSGEKEVEVEETALSSLHMIKVNIKDVKKHPDYYTCLFEEEDKMQGELIEGTMLLDGITKCLLIPFECEEGKIDPMSLHTYMLHK